MKLKRLLAVLAVGALTLVPAAHAIEICITFDNGVVSGEAEFQADSIGGNQYHATSGPLTITGGDGGIALATYGLLPAGPAYAISPSGYFGVDNVAYIPGDPSLDAFGLLFGNTGLPDGFEINLWGNGAGDYTLYANNGFNYHLTSVTAEFCPDGGATVALLGMSLTGLAYVRRKLA